MNFGRDPTPIPPPPTICTTSLEHKSSDLFEARNISLGEKVPCGEKVPHSPRRKKRVCFFLILFSTPIDEKKRALCQ
jgi:hypothetical protein